ncbi:acyl-ACP--UDP-N-acetylglucosamine O-acyltransferase [Candidatus Lariskella endosymbiont of Hedychridium roseum]|uniref:acyl-ACP--UDP-N-acetylglucosamine O-acyltransferase n=1 Tax=Candidatus Lariskella endosymbiont of Hedychridium roseum TaxID=3077949 RepID=UPI0030CBDA6D
MNNIHPTAIISGSAKISDGVQVGPYCIVGPNVELSSNVTLNSHVCVDGHTYIGSETQVFPFASIGYPPQDLKFNGEDSQLIIGKNNIIREYVTMHPGTSSGGMKTVIGNNCLFMVGAHVAHDCVVGDNVILANNATLGGHVVVGDFAILGGLAAVHQFVRIGRHSIIGGLSAVVKDVIPYASVAGDRAKLLGINITGMKRRNFSRKQIRAALDAFEMIFVQETGGTLEERAATAAAKYQDCINVKEIFEFITTNSTRTICLTTQHKDTADE